MNKYEKVEIIELGDFRVLRIESKPPRLEAKITFDKENISQKLIFSLMEIAHKHGFGCSSPAFHELEDSDMTFFIGTILPNSRWLKKYLQRMNLCLSEVSEFSKNFINQLDFTQLDLTMFVDMPVEDIYPEEIATLRDQHYNGSWELFKEAMIDDDQLEEAAIIEKCQKFEKINNKDIGLVGHKLGYELYLLETASASGETN